EKFCALVRPGGFLVVEEPDFTSAKLLNRHGEPSRQRVNNALCRMFEQMGLGPAYGLVLPARMAAAGGRGLEVDSCAHLSHRGDALARMMGESTRALGDRYVATEEAGPEDVEEYAENANDDRLWAVYYSTVSVIAERSQDHATAQKPAHDGSQPGAGNR